MSTLPDVVGRPEGRKVGASRSRRPGEVHVAGLLICLSFPIGVSGQATTQPVWPDSPSPRASKLIYDPTTDRWKELASPEPGTEDGDLDIVRQHVARMDYKEALKLVKAWIKQYGTGAPRYPEALHLQATCELEIGEYRAAHDNFQKLLNDYPGSEYAERALSAEFRLAEQYLAGKKRRAFFGLFKVKDREAGVKIMDDLVANYADTPLAEYAQLAKANYFYSRGDFAEAQEEYATFASEHPRSRYHAYALIRSGEAALATFPGVHFDDAGLVEAQERFTQFMQQYPQVGRERNIPTLLDQIAAARADKTFEIGRHYEKYRQPRAARFYYRQTIDRWPGTAAAEEAKGRLAALSEPAEPAPPAAGSDVQEGGG